jgi:cysteine desulfurase
MKERPIYLDYNATTPIDPEVADAMRPFLEPGLDGGFGNPSSGHAYGRRTRAAIDDARGRVAAAIGASEDEIVFTSGGTEANNHAIRGAAFANRDRGRHIVTSAVEHPAVGEVCDDLSGHGFTTTRVEVDEFGRVDPADVEAAIRPETVLVTVMHANNEVGTIQPIREISEIAHRAGALVHTDAAQSMGKIRVDVDDLGVDLLSIAGHKLYGPKGVGALYIRTGRTIEKLMHGADHEGNRRAGTENVLEIAGLGKACELVALHLDKRAGHMRRLRDRLHDGLVCAIGPLRLNGHPEHRLPNTLSIAVSGLAADAVLAELTDVAASSGAACHADAVSVSTTLMAMRVPIEDAMGTLRLSTGQFLTEEDADRAIDMITEVVLRLRSDPRGHTVNSDS